MSACFAPPYILYRYMCDLYGGLLFYGPIKQVVNVTFNGKFHIFICTFEMKNDSCLTWINVLIYVAK